MQWIGGQNIELGNNKAKYNKHQLADFLSNQNKKHLKIANKQFKK